MSAGHTITDGNTEVYSTASGKISPSEIQTLKARDNYTNIFHIAFVYAVMITTIAATIWSFSLVAEAGLGWWWNSPALILAVVIIGASQHQLGGIIHEGTHYILFKNRKASELISDWFAAFPIYTTTYAFRVHHLAHHQFVNDPVRDPNFAQAKDSGHWLDFPLSHMELLGGIFRLMLPTRLVSYILARARYSAIGVEHNPYANKQHPGFKNSVYVGIAFAVGTPTVMSIFIHNSLYLWSGIVLIGSLLACIIYYCTQPADAFPTSVINPVISHRATAISRLVYLALVYGGVALAQYMTGAPAWNYFTLLWLLPLFTTFPLFMVLREWFQHGNADRGRYTNSHIILVNPLLRYAIFPFGMDYHLPHHLYASVPHYKLKQLHDLMLRKDPQYAEQVDRALIVEGWAKNKSDYPTIVQVLGPEYAPRSEEIHIDPSVLELADINDNAIVEKQIQASKHQGH